MRLGRRVEAGVLAHALVNVVFGAAAVVLGLAGVLSPVVPLVQGDPTVVDLPHPEGVVVASSSAAAPIALDAPRARAVTVRSAPISTTPTTTTRRTIQPSTARLPRDDDARFDRLAACESSGDPKAVNGDYRGAFQFLLVTWHRAGGTGDPIDASYEQQRAIAEAWAKVSDPAAEWPVCWARTA